MSVFYTFRFAELQTYSELDFLPVDDGHCDVIIDRPTVFMKLDAGRDLFMFVDNGPAGLWITSLVK